MIKTIFAAFFIILGVATTITAVIGIFKFKYVLNRMHAAAMCDTLSLMFTGVGVMILYGFTITTLKVMLIIALLWLASPVSSHLIARLEITTNPDEVDKNCEKEEQ